MVSSQLSKLILCLLPSLSLAAEAVTPQLQPARRWADPVVDLPYASYQGYHNESSGLDVWRSIRYAAPPTGLNRWKPPQPPDNQTDGSVIDAKEWPKQCLQSAAGDVERPLDNYNPLQTQDDEDCLFLSVFAPPDAQNLPVYVWFHGGGLSYNSAREFDGQPMVNLANNSIISITVQYRLGIFGFLATPDMGQGLNAGLKDALWSLQWVQEYIHLFGGDPNQVTIGGESAGASFVYTMLTGQYNAGDASPRLFNAAFAASGGGPGVGCGEGKWRKNWEDVSAAAGCYDDLDCLRNVDITRLRVLNGEYGSQGSCVEGPDGYVKKPVVPQMINGEITPVVVVAGNNVNDSYRTATTAVIPSPDSPQYEHDADALFLGYMLQNFPIPVNDSETQSRLLDLYPLSDFDWNNFIRVSEGIQDAGVACCAQYAVEAANKQNKSGYRYLYAVPPGWHAQDNAQEYPYFYYGKEGSAPSPSLFRSFTGLLVSLVITNDPNSPPSIRPANEPDWPAWLPEQRQFKVFNVTEGNVSDAYVADPSNGWEYRIGTKDRCAFWADLRMKYPW